MQQNNLSCIISKIIADFKNGYSSKNGEKHSTVKGLNTFLEESNHFGFVLNSENIVAC